MLIYGANYVIMKKVTPEPILPFALVVFRVVGALALFIISGFFISEKLPKKDILLCAVLAFFGVAANQVLFVNGLSITSPINAAILMLTSPLLVLIISILLKKEKGSLLKYAGVIIGFIGAIIVIMFGTISNEFKSNWRGDLMILFNALSWGIFLIYSKPLMVKYHTITVMKWVFLFGAIYTVPLGIQQVSIIDFNQFSSAVWFNLFYVVVATTFLAYLLNTHALKQLSSSVVSAYIYTQPFLAACFGLMFGMDQLNFMRILGAIVVFVGVYMVSYRPRT